VSAARVAFLRGHYARAVTMAERAATTFDAATPDKASLLATRILLAQGLNASRRFAEALTLAQWCLADAKARATGERSQNEGSALVEIATARQGLGDHTGAREATDLALDHLLPSVGPKARTTERAQALRQRLLDTSAHAIAVSR
jgi:hypothetical protein